MRVTMTTLSEQVEDFISDVEIIPAIESTFLYFFASYIAYKLLAFTISKSFVKSSTDQTDSDYEGESPWDRQVKLLEDLQDKPFQSIDDKYTKFEEVQWALRRSGLETCNLIFGIDFTASNIYQGLESFSGKNLHSLETGKDNPYQHVIKTLGATLEAFDDDKIIPAYGFGDIHSKGHSVFPLSLKEFCNGFMDVYQAYNQVAKTVELSGPTNFAPLIYKALQLVKETKSYHILIIVADGQVTNERHTIEAIEKASFWPLSIIMIGVGDGPWDMMKEFDDELPKRNFDNFQFVEYNKVMEESQGSQTKFAINALMEIPEQYTAIRRLGLLEFDDDEN